MNDYNHNILKSQIEMRKAKNAPGMTEQEYLLNRDILKKAADVINK